MSGARLPLSLRLGRNAMLLLASQFAAACWLGHGLENGFGITFLVQPSVLGTVAVTWAVREIEPRLPGEGLLTVLLGMLSSYLALILAVPASYFLVQAGAPEGAFVWPATFASAFMVALVTRRLVGRWVETAVVGLLGTAFAIGSLILLPIDPKVAALVGLFAWTVASCYFVGLWIDEALEARTAS